MCIRDRTTIDLINTVVYYLEQTGLTVEATLSNDGTTDLFTTRAYDVGFKGKSAFSIDEWYTEYMSTDGLFANIFGGDTSFDDLVAQLSKAVKDEDRNAILKPVSYTHLDVYKRQDYTPRLDEPDYELMRRLAADVDIPVIGEGKIHTPEQAVKALETGVWSIVVGGAITRPLEIATRFMSAIEAARGGRA